MNKKEIIIELRSLGVAHDEEATNEVLLDLLKKEKEKKPQATVSQVPPSAAEPSGDMMELTKQLMAKIAALEAKDIENEKKLKMLYEVADKGRVFNYESSNKEKKPFKVKLSIFNGSIIVGWKTIKDVLVKHPTSGKTIGEQQEYELALLGKDADENYTVKSNTVVNGYPIFSDARYNERIDCDVVGRKEDYSGNIEFDVLLPDNKTITINSRFIN